MAKKTKTNKKVIEDEKLHRHFVELASFLYDRYQDYKRKEKNNDVS